MKKTLSTILALCACGSALADDITISSTTVPADGDKANVWGWQQSLQSDSLSTPSATLNPTVYLSSIDILTPGDVSTQPAINSTTTVKLAIYTANTINSTNFVGISSNTVTFDTSKTLTFNFDNVELNSSTSYYFRFVTNSSNADTQTAQVFRMQMSKVAHGDDEVILWHGDSEPSWLPNYSPYASYTVSNEAPVSVPEPATASLSLLALAGLAARRRRK